MKWLFAVLVALNIIVFGGMVASRVAEKQKTAVAPTVPIVGGAQQELTPPASPAKDSPPEILYPDWINKNEPRPVASEPLDDEVVLAALAQKVKEEELAKERKEREEKAKREQQEKERAAREKAEQLAQEQKEHSRSTGQCVSTASITLDEDAYHRIKGLLQQWPHAASRTVEKRSNSKKSTGPSEKTYRVLVSADGDAIEQLDRLAAKGFSGSLHEGDISVGVVSSRSAAQVLISRLATAGFGGTRIQEQGGRDNGINDRSLSVAKMHVTFFGVDDKTAQAIQNVVDRYGRLNRRSCR
ncbi:hypothetical protein [Neisseria zoodegmatis]|uniref:Periplasmic protein n=1 Tax=Neisseria zoodegmatis TaxID=326523 RepID=A0A1X3CPH4_9NEIS|nr:hypothetical protein [Neisseria zoodegmatis]MDO5070759.1 cell division protein [Neisseria zoodegmatis]OSI09404.1 hypothetical protein BWD10_09915 [Neisseria zoodegmatis]SNU78641.1 Periplasmic protein [Neisseria zoodegmatis]SUA48835.1 Periplasmic protein [Neisseria zoodegmatis]